MTEIKRINTSRPRTGVYSMLARIPGAHLIFVGALSCLRHRNGEMITQQQGGKLSLLLMQDVDFVTGKYLDKIKDACRQVAETRKPEAIILLTGCQSVLLSTDYGMITDEMEAELGIPVRANEGCYLCGFDSAEDVAKADTIEHLLFEFIKPRPKASELTVNILASLPLAPECELRTVLQQMGVTKINELATMTTWEEYQAMGAAQLNIICTTYPETLGKRLEARLGIPYVVLTDEYSPDGIAAVYDKIGEVLGVTPDYAEYKAAADAKFASFRRQYAGMAIEVNGSMKAAKWLLEAGMNVTAVTNNSRSIITKDLNAWFRENAPAVQLKEFSYSGRGLEGEGEKAGTQVGRGGRPEGRGERGGHGGRPDMRGGRDGRGGHGGRPDGRGGHGGHGGRGGFGGRGRHGGGVLVVGFAATDAALREDNFGGRWH